MVILYATWGFSNLNILLQNVARVYSFEGALNQPKTNSFASPSITYCLAYSDKKTDKTVQCI